MESLEKGDMLQMCTLPHVRHAADGFRRRAPWSSCPCGVLTVTAEEVAHVLGLSEGLSKLIAIDKQPTLLLDAGVVYSYVVREAELIFETIEKMVVSL